MTVELVERQAVIHIHLGDGKPVKQKSFFLREVLIILNMDDTKLREKTGTFWKADNLGVEEIVHESGKA